LKEAIVGWRHVFKLDPDRPIADKDLERLCLSGTHAVMVGGSSGVTYENTYDLLRRIRHYTVPCVAELTTEAAIIPGFDLYFVPFVLNTDDAQWIVGRQQRVVKQYASVIPWERVLAEGYVILNGDCTAAKLTRANAGLDMDDLLAFAHVADKMFRFPIFYVEYSGMFGNMGTVYQAKGALSEARLFYGGGIDTLEKARQAAEAAHTIVVGNVIYDDMEKALATVKII
jgi:putative glycerol-1-phosphate prenyltransferase